MSSIKVFLAAASETSRFGYFVFQRWLDLCPWHPIAHANWLETFPYRPDAEFQIAHDAANLYLHYRVAEEFVRAAHIRPNEPVWEDSCVEFFVSFDGRETYYNLEFNVLGTGLIGYGTSDHGTRVRLPEEKILMVKTATEVVQVDGRKKWAIGLQVPLAVFDRRNPSSQYEGLSGTKAFANFYKCGDKLPIPHFLSWNKIDHPTPNFHLPEYFGELLFENAYPPIH